MREPIGLPVNGAAELPDGPDGTGGEDIRGGVAIDQDEIGS